MVCGLSSSRHKTLGSNSCGGAANPSRLLLRVVLDQDGQADVPAAGDGFSIGMSALGHKRTFSDAEAMSALPPKVDMCSALADVR